MSKLSLAATAAMLIFLPGAAWAQDSAESETIVLDEVTVTGEKVERSIMDTASSVSVTGAHEIEARPGLSFSSNILDRIPNVVGSETSNLMPAVRGLDGTGPAQGADAFLAGTRPRLNYQLDGRTLSYNESVFSDSSLWDIERVEVYRGPQSTLQGRNAIAGAVIIKSADPTWDYEALGRLLWGTNETYQASAAVSGPIIDNQLAFRLAVDGRRSESFVSGMTPYEGRENPREHESFSLRAKLLAEPAAIPELSALLTYSHTDTKAPQTSSVRAPFSPHQSSYPPMPVFGTRADTGIADVTYEISEQFTLQTLLSATDLRVRRWAMPMDGNAEINATEYVVEPRLSFSLFGDRLKGFVGLHYFDNSQDEALDLFGGASFDDKTTTTAAFGEATFKATDVIELTLGGRLEREERDRTGSGGPFAIDFHETYEVFLPKFGIAWHVEEDLTIGATATRGYNGGSAGFTYDVPFVSYSYAPEYVWSYEAYVRTKLLDDRLTLTGNVFYSDYKDLQLPIDLNDDPNVWTTIVVNADDAVTYGVEAEARWQALDELELFASVGLLQTEIKSAPVVADLAQQYGIAASNVDGNDLPRSPAFTFDFGAYYEHESGVDVGVAGHFTDAYYSGITTPRGKTDPYFVADLQVGYRYENARIFGQVTNVFDAMGPTFYESETVATVLQPRTFAVGLQVDF